ncbi:MAG: chromosomal replication initiator protein DnaA [Solirubrobacterales bacterium]|nr:chromosomal replication initiator protein DnaA [Solirubrobacterales bacterium]
MELPAQLEPTVAWREVRAELRRVVGESTYDIWLAPLELESFAGANLVLSAPPATQSWVVKRFGRILESCAQAVLGANARVSFAGRRQTGDPREPRESPGVQGHHRAEIATEELNPRYSFDQFIIGDGNRLAHAASLAVAELPGQAYNPLFLHGPPGLGKTHLLHAIGNYVRAFGAGATVRYATVEAFTNHFIAALTSRSLENFKHAYRDAGVLLIDDVQFLASKAKTEEEFFHTFNALYETGGQLVLTCDRLPRQLLTVEERLRERFESGLVVDIGPPDFATRVAILRKRAALDRIPLADEAVPELVAERVTDNVRALEGALIRIVAYHSLTRNPIDLSLATAVLDGMHPSRARAAPSIGDIQLTVATHYGLSVSDLVSPSRTARIAWPRQVAIALSRELTEASLPVIGQAFGGRNHATVLHACKRVSDRLLTDQQAAVEVDGLRSTVRGAHRDRPA